jgi:hypothetical protein
MNIAKYIINILIYKLKLFEYKYLVEFTYNKPLSIHNIINNTD